MLHVCCAPDLVSFYFEERGKEHSMLLFYNRISILKSILQRYHAFRSVCQEMGVECPEPDYSPRTLAIHDSFEDEPERGHRCTKCIELRAEKGSGGQQNP
jgi:predicted adenine nucleotide alpha hydrolase (AANH) superfamily ATPase